MIKRITFSYKKGFIFPAMIPFMSVLFSFHPSFSQVTPKEVFAEYENRLIILSDSLIKSKSDTTRDSANALLLLNLQEVLRKPGSFDYPFDSLKNISILSAPDKSFRIFSWMLARFDGTSYRYFGIIQTYHSKKKKSTLYGLHDSSAVILQPETARLSPQKWYGAAYYKMLMTKKSGKRYYTLLGWKGHNRLSTKKVIEVIHFSGSKIYFGAPVFQVEKRSRMRIAFEYSAKAVMALRYENDMELIVFDHLSPDSPEFVGDYSHYGPDFSYDGFSWEKGKWILVRDIDPKNPKKYDKKVPYSDPHKPEKQKRGFKEKPVYESK